MLITILGFITGIGPALAQIAQKIADLQIAKVQATTDQERARLDAEISEAHARRDTLVAEAGSRINAIMRGLLAAGPTIYLNKVFIFDKVIGSLTGQTSSIFSTDPLDANLWKVVVAVIAFYFVYDMAARFRK